MSKPEEEADDPSFESGPSWHGEDADGPSEVSEPSDLSDLSDASYGTGGSYVSQDSLNRPVPTLASTPMSESTLPFDPAGAYAEDPTARQLVADGGLAATAGLEPFPAAGTIMPRSTTRKGRS